jgi:hypothetical protein
MMLDLGLEEELLFGSLNIKIFKLQGLKQAAGMAYIYLESKFVREWSQIPVSSSAQEVAMRSFRMRSIDRTFDHFVTSSRHLFLSRPND